MVAFPRRPIVKLLLSLAALFLAASLSTQAGPSSAETLGAAFGNTPGTLVLIEGETGDKSIFNPKLAGTPFAPCSTFKIWNTLIGLENGLITSADQDFYHWDGEKRFIPDWNKNLTLKQAFQVSCVPAFQDLARQIGPARMQAALDKIGYGDRNISAGIDVFWLPAADRKTILISPLAQADLMRKLAEGDVPFSKKSQAVLKEIMTARSTLRGTLYGKTGSSGNDADGQSLGWYVGYVESNGKTFAFACLVRGKDLMGKDARAIVEAVAEKEGWL
jgi:beta-lactamase class D